MCNKFQWSHAFKCWQCILSNTFMLCLIVSATMRDNQMDGDMGWIDGLAWLPLGNNTLESTEQAVSYTKTASVVSQQSTRLGFPSVGVVQNLSNTDLSADGFSYVCPKCHKRYRWRDSLRRHQRVECGLEPKHACPTCGRMFKHKHQMVVHGRIHHS